MENKNNRKKYLYLTIILIFTIIIFGYNNFVFAEINEGYATETISGGWLKNVELSSGLLNPIGTFLLWVGGFIQMVLTSISLVISGQEQTVMPWADAIIFNAVPVLDVNFISPAKGSIMSSLTSVIRTMYYSVLGLSLVFFSISVMIMAIKLAISSIAEEKARYKEAIANWLKGILLIFLIHFFMSFIFFLNETLVKVASNITTDILEKQDTIFDNSPYYDMLLSDAKEIDNTYATAIADNKVFFSSIMSEGNEVVGDLFGFNKKGKDDYQFKLINNWKLRTSTITKKQAIERVYTIWVICTYTKLTDEQIINLRDVNKRQAALEEIFAGSSGVAGVNDNLKNWIIDKDNVKARETTAELFIKYTAFFQQINAGKSGHQSGETSNAYTQMAKKTPITKMADYFRKNAYTPKEDSYVKTDINMPFAIMYLMFAVQSLLYFFAYAKRLFYVVIFAIMAPAIIVWDFVNKS